jgi:rhodanese-related sulfurtransferase
MCDHGPVLIVLSAGCNDFSSPLGLTFGDGEGYLCCHDKAAHIGELTTVEMFQADTYKMVLIGVMVIVFLRFLPRIKAKMLGIPFVNVHDVKQRMDAGEGLLVIDVRTAGEFTGNLGHIEGALNLDASALSSKLTDLADKLEPYKDEPIVITCRTDNRSPGAARVLFQHGFKNLAIMGGGMSGWNRAGYPVAYKR